METRKRNKPVCGEMVTTQVSEKAGVGIGKTLASKVRSGKKK
jgi:hypothetical protein